MKKGIKFPIFSDYDEKKQMKTMVRKGNMRICENEFSFFRDRKSRAFVKEK